MALTYTELMTLRTAGAWMAIGDLTARCNRTFEAGHKERWLATFLPEGVLERPDGETLTGHGALAKFFASAQHDRLLATTDVQLSVEGVHARQDSRLLVLRPESDGSGVVIEAAGRVRDEVVHERGEWYFARRTVVLDRGANNVGMEP